MYYITIAERCCSLVDVLNSPFFKYASNIDAPYLYELHRGSWKYEGLLNIREFRQKILDAVAGGYATL